MSLYWFVAGIVMTLAATFASLRWLRKFAVLAALPAPPWSASAAAVIAAAAFLGLGFRLQRPSVPPDDVGEAMRVFDASTAAASTNAAPVHGAGGARGAGSMQSAIASLESRLAKHGGTPGDWDLLAKAYEFVGRPAAAAKARAHVLPDAPGSDARSGGAMPNVATPAGGTVIHGEVRLADAVGRRVQPGETLFVFAQSVASSGPPVAVFRTQVDHWPLRFRLDDGQAMLPGRDLSNAGPVKIVARLSPSGQPLRSSGDFEGATSAIDPTKVHAPVTIVIDRAIP